MPSQLADIHPSSQQPVPSGPLSADFARQQASKQVGNNYHSSSLSTMISQSSVNKTSLHPGGVQYESSSHLPLASPLIF